MEKKFFALMEHDHTLPKNKLQEEYRKRVKEDFSQTLIESPAAAAMCLDDLATITHSSHRKCKPIKGSFCRWDGKYSSHCYYEVYGLFKLTFYPVKEVSNA